MVALVDFTLLILCSEVLRYLDFFCSVQVDIVWLAVKVEVLLHYLCHAFLYAGYDPVTHMVFVIPHTPVPHYRLCLRSFSNVEFLTF